MSSDGGQILSWLSAIPSNVGVTFLPGANDSSVREKSISSLTWRRWQICKNQAFDWRQDCDRTWSVFYQRYPENHKSDSRGSPRRVLGWRNAEPAVRKIQRFSERTWRNSHGVCRRAVRVDDVRCGRNDEPFLFASRGPGMEVQFHRGLAPPGFL